VTHHRSSTRTSAVVLLSLLGLLALSVIAAHFPLGIWSSIVALGIAAIKAGLIAWFFMHLRDETTLIRVFSLAGLFCLAVMFTLLTSDYGDRHLERLERHPELPVDRH
jgi:cytochrome c oxidase subunit 4